MPRKQKPSVPRRTDLVGTWYQCQVENAHLTDEPIFVGDFPYCDKGDCSGLVVLVHSSHDDQSNVDERRRVWNSMSNPSIGKLVRDMKSEKEDAAPAPEELAAEEDTKIEDVTPADLEAELEAEEPG